MALQHEQNDCLLVHSTILFLALSVAVSCPCHCLNSTKSPNIKSSVFGARGNTDYPREKQSRENQEKLCVSPKSQPPLIGGTRVLHRHFQKIVLCQNSCYYSRACRQSFFCLRLHSDEAYGSIQWKLTHKPRLHDKTADNCNNSHFRNTRNQFENNPFKLISISL